MTARVLDLFAGPGGWDEGLRLLGYQGELVGVDHDLSACRSATAAGHVRVQADITELDPQRFTAASLGWSAVDGLIGSPPCQAWSVAGKGGGELDRARCHALVDAYAQGGPERPAGIRWTDPRSSLVAEPVRWVQALRPRWVALEQVPPVLGLWEHVARVLRDWGYRVWCGILAAEAYGVPQTRRRAILMASLDGPAYPPVPTHQEYRSGRELDTEGDLFGPPLPPPVSMAQALGWDGVDRPARTVCGNRGPRWAYEQANSTGTGWTLANGRQPNATVRSGDEPAPTVFCSRPGNLVLRNGNQANACVRSIDEPAGTMFFGARANAVDWVVDTVQTQRWRVRPATTVQGDARIWPPGHKVNADDTARLGEDEARERYGDRAGTDAVRVSVVEAAVLQGFRPDYPWRGSKTARYRQIGDAVPPPLATSVLAPLLAAAQRAEGGSVTRLLELPQPRPTQPPALWGESS